MGHRVQLGEKGSREPAEVYPITCTLINAMVMKMGKEGLKKDVTGALWALGSISS